MARIQIRDLSKRFGETEVLSAVSLEVEDGTIAALLGPSGCGKSTTLFILAGLYQPSGGDVLFDGVSQLGVHPRERNVGLVFQSYALYPHMTVRENIAFPLVLQKVAKADVERRVAEVAALTGLQELMDRRPSQLSGGQQQRVASARAIVKRPRLLLMDEPLSNLDVELRARMRRELKRVQRESKVTMIIVTHDQEEAMSMADRVFVMQGGQIQQAGGHRDLYERPANRFVAGFVGAPAMNFIEELALARAGDTLWVESRGRRVVRAGPGGVVASFGADKLAGAVLGVRPEHVGVTVGEPGGDGGVSARVIDLVPHGREFLLGLDLGGELELRSIVPARLDVALGAEVTVRIDEEFVHLFDARSGAVLHHGGHGRQAQETP